MKPTVLKIGHRVVDPMDDTIRTIRSINGNSVFMEDGGVMGADEIDCVYESEERIKHSDLKDIHHAINDRNLRKSSNNDPNPI